MNLATQAALLSLLGKHVGELSDVFKTGGGLPYSRFRPEFTDWMDRVNRATYDERLVDLYLPVAGGLVDRLRDGISVADIGCGTGHCIKLMAAAFPASECAGYDIAVDAIERARTEAKELGLTNVTFEVRDV